MIAPVVEWVPASQFASGFERRAVAAPAAPPVPPPRTYDGEPAWLYRGVLALAFTVGVACGALAVAGAAERHARAAAPAAACAPAPAQLGCKP